MDMMVARAHLQPLELESRQRNDLTIALTVSFEYESGKLRGVLPTNP